MARGTPPQPHTVKFACINWKVASSGIGDLSVRFVRASNHGRRSTMLFTSSIRSMDGVLIASLSKMAVKVRVAVELGKTKLITQKVNLRS